MKRFLTATLLLFCLALFACAQKKQEENVKRYPVTGTIQGLDAKAKSATIDAGKIGDWMEAMTMEYPVKPDAEFQKLHVGDKIEATVVVADVKYYVTDIKVK